MATIQAILAMHRRGTRTGGLPGCWVFTGRPWPISEGCGESKPAKRPTGSPDESTVPGDAKRAIAPGPASQCERFRETIAAKVEAGLSAVRIFQDLVEEGFEGKYWSVRRYVTRLTAPHDLPMRRLETLPGEEAQIDFGTGASPDARREARRPWVFRVVLSHSRKAYSEAVWRQTTEAFLQCLENAFHQFGGAAASGPGQLEGRGRSGRLVRPRGASQAPVVRRALRYGIPSHEAVHASA